MNEIANRIEELFPNEADRIKDLFNFSLLEEFLGFLREKNEIGGFFSKSDYENVLDRHVIECLYHIYVIQKEIPISTDLRVADVGTGPGLPGFIFACMKNPPYLTLIDSQKRKLKHLEEFVKGKKIQKVRFQYLRMEEVEEKFSLLVMRSSIPYPWSIEMVGDLVLLEGYFVPFLGRKTYSVDMEKDFLKNFGFTVMKEQDLPELEFLGNRHIRFLQKTNSIQNARKRVWSVIQKEIRKENG